MGRNGTAIESGLCTIASRQNVGFQKKPKAIAAIGTTPNRNNYTQPNGNTNANTGLFVLAEFTVRRASILSREQGLLFAARRAIFIECKRG
jgi:hypothetical protein